jgi:hypothetical protein
LAQIQKRVCDKRVHNHLNEDKVMRGRGGMRQGAGRKGRWQNGETQTIRVPVALKEDLVTLGQQLDQGQGVIAGKPLMQLETVLAHWQEQSHLHPEESWEPVRQLLGEIEAILAQGSCRGRGRQGLGRNQHRCRFEGVPTDSPEDLSKEELTIEVSVN